MLRRFDESPLERPSPIHNSPGGRFEGATAVGVLVTGFFAALSAISTFEELGLVKLRTNISGWVDAYRSLVDRLFRPMFSWLDFDFVLPGRVAIHDLAMRQGTDPDGGGWVATGTGTFWKAVHDLVMWIGFDWSITETETLLLSTIAIVAAASARGYLRGAGQPNKLAIRNAKEAIGMQFLITASALMVGSLLALILDESWSVVAAAAGVCAILITGAIQTTDEPAGRLAGYVYHTMIGFGFAVALISVDYVLFQQGLFV